MIPGKTHWGINFTLNAIDLEYDSNKGECGDYIQFWLGGWKHIGNPEYQLTDKICGTSVDLIPKRSFIGKEKKMTVLFKTNGSKQFSGFKAQYVRVNLTTLNSMNVGNIESLGNSTQVNSANVNGNIFDTLYSKIIMRYSIADLI